MPISQSKMRCSSSRDQAWKEIEEWEQRLERILETGFQDEKDVRATKAAIHLVLAEIKWNNGLRQENETST